MKKKYSKPEYVLSDKGILEQIREMKPLPDVDLHSLKLIIKEMERPKKLSIAKWFTRAKRKLERIDR